MEMWKSRWWSPTVLLPLFLFAPVKTFAGAPEYVGRWEAGRCPVILEADREDGVLFLRARCPLLPEDATKALSETLPRLRNLGQFPTQYRVLFLGRLVDYPWLAKGLARWAAGAATWDPRQARPRREKNVNRFVANALMETRLLAPLTEALGREGLRLTDVSVEKVLVARVRELPFGADLVAEGIPRGARVPYDALVHLRLSHTEGAVAVPR